MNKIENIVYKKIIKNHGNILNNINNCQVEFIVLV